MRRWALLSALLVCGLAVCGLTGRPAGATHYSGPPSDFTAYWAVPAFDDVPTRGPQNAKGVIFWSHGVDGNKPQYLGHPPELIHQYARDGWDVIKVQRNNLHESTWAVSGPRHVGDLVERIKAARAQGYKAVIAAGQSYGGIISLEAGAVTDELHAVLAFSPGHGSDATNIGSTGRRFDMLTDMMLAVLAKQKAQRVMLLVAEGDDYHPFEVRGARSRAALIATGRSFLLFDETMPIKGHLSGMTSQFQVWYGKCLAEFVDPAKEVPAGETVCKPPAPLPKFLLPKLNAFTTAPGTPPELTRLNGTWIGAWSNESPVIYRGVEICLIVEDIRPDAIKIVYAGGTGPRRNQNMFAQRRTAHAEGGRVIVAGDKSNVEIQATPTADADVLDLTVISVNRQNRFMARLRRGDCL
jgi:pimeloyl-ACP methyl ester carboxylesterase